MKPPFAINGWDRDLPLEITTILQNSLSHRSGHWSLRFWASNSFLCSWQYGFQDFGILEPTMSPLGWYQNSSQGTNVLKLFRNRWSFQASGMAHLFPRIWKDSYACESTWTLPDEIRGSSKRGSTTETLCALLPGHPALHYPLPTLGSRDHSSDVPKFVGIWSTQDSSSWHQSYHCLHSLL